MNQEAYEHPDDQPPGTAGGDRDTGALEDLGRLSCHDTPDEPRSQADHGTGEGPSPESPLHAHARDVRPQNLDRASGLQIGKQHRILRRLAEQAVHGPADTALNDPYLFSRNWYDGLRLSAPWKYKSGEGPEDPRRPSRCV